MLLRDFIIHEYSFGLKWYLIEAKNEALIPKQTTDNFTSEEWKEFIDKVFEYNG